jgi:hypothetical protein
VVDGDVDGDEDGVVDGVVVGDVVVGEGDVVVVSATAAGTVNQPRATATITAALTPTRCRRVRRMPNSDVEEPGDGHGRAHCAHGGADHEDEDASP